MLNPDDYSADDKIVVMLGCFDTKGEDFSYLRSCLLRQSVKVISINTGVLGTTSNFQADFEAAEVAEAAGAELLELRAKGDRGQAIQKMGEGAARIIKNLFSQGKVDGVISMGGGGGTYIALSAMQVIPFGIPKLCLSTLATKDLSHHIGSKDITLIPSVVDVAGLNSISMTLINQASGAICGMINSDIKDQFKTSGSIAMSIFGNTTACVDKCVDMLRSKTYDVLTFHAVGVGGKTMESLILEGCFDAVLDITTTELADDLCDGICSAGPDRLTAAAQMGIPQVVVPGCLDMVNFGAMDTVPERYRSRQLYSWAPDVTLMRTNMDENRILGQQFAEKLNRSKGKVVVLLPLKGISKISSEGEVFHNTDTDEALFTSIKKHAGKSIKIVEVDANINDPLFAEQAVHQLLELMGK
ncbi:Tm-1-like ATP-binding domain-containing protein [Fulvivirgaceae bacterium BMA12]|uniref:Tm-1-like ATP-binding domain-containing protein n=1 Tax=Agaribacillus aureus TaxID=3051825 RepID=A0ABT8L6S4_9BACT|nr:Tm-1-like ATP-binding domain-containing protein [Fulvivirgaceae bacterium BMA12]